MSDFNLQQSVPVSGIDGGNASVETVWVKPTLDRLLMKDALTGSVGGVNNDGPFVYS